MNPRGDNFANGAVWYTIILEVSTFYFMLPKTGDQNCPSQ